MSKYKIVMLPIEVPDCDYCWEPANHLCCDHFDNKGGHPACVLGIASLKPDGSELGQRKPAACLALN